MYKKLLVPLDGSMQAGQAAEYAMELAKCMDSEVLFLHVIPALPPYENYQSQQKTETYQQIHNDLLIGGREIIEGAKEDYSNENINTSFKILWGNPAMEICRLAKEENFDLIIMGNRGLGGVKGYLMGSVSNRVVRHASCPVMIVR